MEHSLCIETGPANVVGLHVEPRWYDVVFLGPEYGLPATQGLLRQFGSYKCKEDQKDFDDYSSGGSFHGSLQVRNMLLTLMTRAPVFFFQKISVSNYFLIPTISCCIKE